MKRSHKIALLALVTATMAVGAGTALFTPVAYPDTSPQPAKDTVIVVSGVIVPPQLAVPSGQNLVATLEVVRGSQVYTCTSGTFTLLEPAAVLRAGDQFVLHTRGPEWVSANDGSAVVGSVVASVPEPNAVPELLLKSTANRGTGLLGDVDYVQRLATVGGVAPTGTCVDGQQVAVPYHAQYRFYAPATW